MTTDEAMARLEATAPGMALPISAEYVQGAWTLFSHGTDGEEWVVGTVEGGSMEQRAQKAAYLVAAANALPSLLAVARAAHEHITALFAPGVVQILTPDLEALMTATNALAALGEGGDG